MQSSLANTKDLLLNIKRALEQDKIKLESAQIDTSKLAQNIHEALLRAEAPIRVGVVGEFSSGKSLLLSGLLGRADLLPTSEIPTTGNITELILHPSDQRETTISSRVVHFMTRERVNELCEAFHEELHRELKNAHLLDLETQGYALLARIKSEGLANVQADLERWGDELWRKVTAGAIRSNIKEYIVFVRAAISGIGLCGQQQIIDAPLMDALLRIEGQDTQRVITFEQIPRPKHQVLTQGDITSDSLISFKSLIQKITLDVQVPYAVWDLSELSQIGRVALVDFPGVGASDSKVRDAFLCRSEIQDMQTFLLLLNATRPGSGGANELYSMMKNSYQGDLDQAIILGIARINQMTFNPNVEFSMPLREDEVINKQDEYRKLMESALPFIGGDTSRLSFLMQNCAFYPLLSAGYKAAELGIHEDLARRLGEYEEKTNSFWSYWGSLALEVKKQEPNAPITRLLDSETYEKGGGVLMLKEILTNHVKLNGLEALNSKLNIKRREITRSVQEIINAYIHKQQQETLTNPDLSRLLAELLAHYQQIKHRLEKEPIRFLSQYEGMTLFDELRLDVCQKISENAHFQKLINAVDSSNLKLPHETLGHSESIFGALFEDETKDTYLQAYHELGELYDQTSQALHEELHKKVQYSIGLHLESLASSETLSRLKLKLDPYLNSSEGSPVVRFMKNILTPESLKDPLLNKSVFTVDLDTISQGFPYSRERKICWNIENNTNYPDETDRHPDSKFHYINILLIRQNVVDATIHSLEQAIKRLEANYHDLFKSAVVETVKNLTENSSRIAQALSNSSKNNVGNDSHILLQKVILGDAL